MYFNGRFFKVRMKKMLSEERKIQINQVVEDLSRKHNELNVPVFDIIKFLKEKEGFAVASKIMDKDTTGILIIDDNEIIPESQSHKLIVINSRLQDKDDFIQRRRFIIGHEYGHSILHKKDSKQYAHRDTSNKDDEIEQEADYFARCLLMPESIMKAILSISFIEILPLKEKAIIISRIFNVTINKATQRLKEDFGYNG